MNQLFLNAHSKKIKYWAENISCFVSRKGASTISFELQMTKTLFRKALTKF